MKGFPFAPICAAAALALCLGAGPADAREHGASILADASRPAGTDGALLVADGHRPPPPGYGHRPPPPDHRMPPPKHKKKKKKRHMPPPPPPPPHHMAPPPHGHR